VGIPKFLQLPRSLMAVYLINENDIDVFEHFTQKKCWQRTQKYPKQQQQQQQNILKAFNPSNQKEWDASWISLEVLSQYNMMFVMLRM
jgi:hypothetical protein